MPPHLWLAFVAASAVMLVIPGPTILPLLAGVALGDSTALAASLLMARRPA